MILYIILSILLINLIITLSLAIRLIVHTRDQDFIFKSVIARNFPGQPQQLQP